MASSGTETVNAGAVITVASVPAVRFVPINEAIARTTAASTVFVRPSDCGRWNSVRVASC